MESFNNNQSFSDGEILWKIRHYTINRDRHAEETWWARLADIRSQNAKRLVRNRSMIDAFDKLLRFPGMWQPIVLGTLHSRFFNLRCDEVCRSDRGHGGLQKLTEVRTGDPDLS